MIMLAPPRRGLRRHPNQKWDHIVPMQPRQCYLSAAKQLNYLDVSNFITITSCSARSSKNGIYVDLTDQPKVCDFSICCCYCEGWLLIMCDLSLHALVIAILMAYLLTHCARHCVMPQLHAVVNFTC